MYLIMYYPPIHILRVPEVCALVLYSLHIFHRFFTFVFDLLLEQMGKNKVEYVHKMEGCHSNIHRLYMTITLTGMHVIITMEGECSLLPLRSS